MAKDSVKDYLVNWTVTYLKNRDVISKSIEDIDTNNKDIDILVKYKDSQLAIIVEPFLKDIAFLERLKAFKEKSIKTRLITVNAKDNLKFITSNWKAISEFDRGFNIFFVNPFSKLEMKWIIYPQTHASIGGKSFERGLKTLFATVEPINEKEFEKLI